MTDPAQAILDKLDLPNETKAQLWDAYHGARNEAEFRLKFDKMGVPNDVKADLYDAKNFTPAQKVQPKPAVPAKMEPTTARPYGAPTIGDLQSGALGVIEGAGIDPSNPISNTLKGLWNLGKATVGTLEGYNSSNKALQKMIFGPSLDQFHEAKQYWDAGSVPGAVVHGAAGMVPMVGPMAAGVGREIREGAETGDTEKIVHGVGRGIGLVGGLAAGTEEGQAAIDAGVTGLGKAVVKGTKASANFIARRTADVLGVTTGAGSEAIREAFKNPSPELIKAMRGQTSEAEIVQGFKDAVNDIKETRGAAYREQLANLPSTDMSAQLGELRTHAEDQLSNFGIRKTIDSNGKPKLDFSRSTISDAGEQAKIKGLFDDIRKWGARAGDATPLGLDTMKRRIADLWSDSGQARALIQSVKKKTDSILNQVPNYSTMTKDYATASDFISKIEKEFSVGPNANLGTAIRKISYALKQNNEYRSLMIDALDGKTGSALKEQLAGYHLSQPTARGLTGALEGVGTGLGVLSGHVPPSALPALLATSPRIVGEIVTGLGRIAKRGALPAAEETAAAAGAANAATTEDPAITAAPAAATTPPVAAPPVPTLAAVVPTPAAPTSVVSGGAVLPPPTAAPRWGAQAPQNVSLQSMAAPGAGMAAPEAPAIEGEALGAAAIPEQAAAPQPITLKTLLDLKEAPTVPPEWVASRYQRPSPATLAATAKTIPAAGPPDTALATRAQQMIDAYLHETDMARSAPKAGEGHGNQEEHSRLNDAGVEDLETRDAAANRRLFTGHGVKSDSPVAHFTQSADEIAAAMEKGKGKLYDQIVAEFKNAARQEWAEYAAANPTLATAKRAFSKWLATTTKE